MERFFRNPKTFFIIFASICIYGCEKNDVNNRTSNSTYVNSDQYLLTREIETNYQYPESKDLSSTQDGYKIPTTSWRPEGSQYIYHQDGTSSWQPEGSQYIYHQDGTSSWQPEGGQYIYNQN